MSDTVEVTPEVLAEHPLPDHGESSSKQDRGDVLVVGGTAETPGAVLLAGVAALRAGAGRLQINTVAETAPGLALQVPEARVVGSLDASELASTMAEAAAVLLGPGTFAPDESRELAAAAVEAMRDTDGVLVLDAGALGLLGEQPDLLAPLGDRAVAMPNPGEAAEILGDDGAVGDDDLEAVLAALVDRCRCVVTVRGGDTWIAAPGTPHHVDRSGCVGLATCGSGDVLAGLVAGLAARGTGALGSVLWATRAHGRAGQASAERWGEVGFLARHLLDEVRF